MTNGLNAKMLNHWAIVSSRHPGLVPWFDTLTTLSEVEGGSSKSCLLLAKGFPWILDPVFQGTCFFGDDNRGLG